MPVSFKLRHRKREIIFKFEIFIEIPPPDKTSNISIGIVVAIVEN